MLRCGKCLYELVVGVRAALGNGIDAGSDSPQTTTQRGGDLVGSPPYVVKIGGAQADEHAYQHVLCRNLSTMTGFSAVDNCLLEHTGHEVPLISTRGEPATSTQRAPFNRQKSFRCEVA